MNDIILLKLGETVLKGGNRRLFEQKFEANVRRRIAHCGEFKVYTKQSMVYVEPLNEKADIEQAFEAVHYVFGAVAVTRAAACEKDVNAIVETAKHYLGDALTAAKTFKVESKRSDKSFPMTSIEVSQYVGGELHDAYPHLTVDVHEPELLINVEIRDKAAFVHGRDEPGAGGMPVGSNGKAVTLLSGGIDSPVASYMIARRGVSLIPLHFFSFPYTSEQAKQKVLDLAEILRCYCGKMKVAIVPFTKIQEEIRRKCPEELFTIIMRRFMMRIAQRVAEDNGCKAIVTGESLGQVASQTMEAMAVTGEVCSLPILRPVIGMDKEDIIRIARRIGTFETSILPFEDCCTVFTPRHPRTKPKLEDVIEAEANMDVAALVEEAVHGIYRA